MAEVLALVSRLYRIQRIDEDVDSECCHGTSLENGNAGESAWFRVAARHAVRPPPGRDVNEMCK